MNYDKFIKVLNNLTNYINYLPTLFNWSESEATNFIEKFMNVIDDIKELRKSVFINPNILKKDKKNTFENLKQNYINAIINDNSISV
jgi:hypothetical protein